eukprot:GHRQ01011333.1.p1 GENE.GHRQ01011333.1~~GHRQ01011333.1.p1  ORF type:complete len:107 (+),score=30.41 GHRQ01011333.1:507-827(+)
MLKHAACAALLQPGPAVPAASPRPVGSQQGTSRAVQMLAGSFVCTPVLCCLQGCRCCIAQVRITPLTTKRVEHTGIKVQLLGQIELASERGSPHDFVSLGKHCSAG